MRACPSAAPRPARIDFDPGLRWRRLEIVNASGGTPFHSEATVEFRARYTHRGTDGELHEISRFVRHDGAWVYLAALPSGQGTARHRSPHGRTG